MSAVLDVVALRSLVAVADCGGFHRAAAALYLTQSAISQHLRKLERVTDRRLVVREGRQARFTAEGELTRKAVNDWLRSEGIKEADAVVDFDAAVRDPDHPSRFRPDLHSGDWLHPSDAGYQAMAEAVPLDACD